MDLTNALLLTAGLLGHTCLTVLLLRHGVRRVFPVFVVYQFYAALAVAIRLAMVLFKHLWYPPVFWGTELGFLVLGIAASHEAFRWVFSGFYRLTWFRWFYY